MKRISLLVFVVVFSAGCDRKHQAPPMPPPAVATVTAHSGEIRNRYELIGTVKPFRGIRLVSRIAGFIRERNFQEGSFVKAGTLLYLIDPAPYRLELDRARAGVEKARADELDAQLEYKRVEELFREKLVAQKRFDSARARLQSASAQLRSAVAQAGTAELNLGYTRITAPFDGWMGLNRIDVGNYVTAPSAELAELVDIGQVRVEFHPSDAQVTGNLLSALAAGKAPPWKVTLRLQDGSAYPGEGEIVYWNNRLSGSTATLAMQALFPNPEHRLAPGLYVTVELTDRNASTAVLIDRRSLRSDQGKDFVFVVTPDNVLAFRPVELGATEGNFRIVRGGLRAGEQVALAGNPLLRSGMTIRAVPAGEPDHER